MDCIMNDLCYVCSRVVYDDMDADERLVVRNRVKDAYSYMGKLAREHIDWPFEAVANYDY